MQEALRQIAENAGEEVRKSRGQVTLSS